MAETNASSELDGFEKRLRSLLYRFDCPPAIEIGEYYLGLVGDPRKAWIAEHLETCPHCGLEYARLRTFMAQPEQPAAEQRVEKPGVLDRIKWLVAELVAPPQAGALAPAYRGAESRMRSYRTQEYDISLEVNADREHPNHWQLIGLVMGPDVEGMIVSLAPPGEKAGQPIGTVDDAGNFMTSDVIPGLYDLLLSRPDRSVNIRIPDLEVRM